MRLALSLVLSSVVSLALGLLSTGSLAAARIRIVNDAAMPTTAISQLNVNYAHWAERVYRYNHVAQPLPVTLVISRQVRIGYYQGSTVYLPLDDDPDEMLETFVHELSHHATGHQSSFFFKEGIATHTTEALFAEDARIPQGWPQYGISSDAWVSLFLRRGELPALAKLVASEGFDSATQEADFRGWQSYLIASNFLGWLIDHQGYEAFRTAFREQSLGDNTAEWERRWLASIRAKKLPPVNAAAELPQLPRYQYYAKRLAG